MFSLGILTMVGVIMFVIGGLLGAVISRSLFPPEQQKLLEESLSTTRSELEKYQTDVAQHFAETAKLVNKLSDNYKEVHEHLSHGAVKLANAEISREMLKAGNDSLGIETKIAHGDELQVPKDWAPKVPGQKGTLSEEYGLDDYKDQPEEVLDPSPHKTLS